ncbi:putative non-specific serine/threonine protein kinase [Helianthus annuus]|nr:putative non-specific serine/threonine protein kinase [Helianthus annuus]
MGNCHRKLRNNLTNNKATEQQPSATVTRGRSNHGGSTACQESVLPRPRGQIVTPNLKKFSYAELQTATKNFRPSSILGEGGFGQVFKGWVDGVTYAPSKAGVGIPVAVKKLDSGSIQGLKEWQVAGL